jgi:FkbM family methyltransferase
MQICFAQHGEDLVLGRALGWDPPGFYVDVGAAHPTSLSVTRLFYERGWRGINIEPLPQMFQLLTRARPRDLNLHMAASDRTGEFGFFQIAAAGHDDRTNGTGLSTFDRELADRYRAQGHAVTELKIPTTTLDDVLAHHAAATIDFLKLDVEGHESTVLSGLNLARFRPRILLIEAVRPLTDTPCFSDWEPSVIRHDYRFVASDGVNRYYVRGEEPELIARIRIVEESEYVRIGTNGRAPPLKRWLKPYGRRVQQWLGLRPPRRGRSQQEDVAARTAG